MPDNSLAVRADSLGDRANAFVFRHRLYSLLFPHPFHERVDEIPPSIREVIVQHEKERSTHENYGQYIRIDKRNRSGDCKYHFPSQIHRTVKPQRFQKARQPTVDFRL